MRTGETLWRARKHDEHQTVWDVDQPFPAEGMKPPKNCREVRTNPKNIPCLYLAMEEKTAGSEVGPGSEPL